MRVKCFAQEQNTVYRARTRTRPLDLQAKFVRNLGDLGVTLDSKKVKFGEFSVDVELLYLRRFGLIPVDSALSEC